MKSNQSTDHGLGRCFALGLIVVFSLGLAGCICTSPKPPAQHVYTGPVIDIHTHLFNVMDVPVIGILYSQGKQLVTPELALAITNRVKEVVDDLPRDDMKGNLVNADVSPQITKGPLSIEAQKAGSEWKLIQHFVRSSGTVKALTPLPPLLTRLPEELTPGDKEELLVEVLANAGFLAQEAESPSAPPTKGLLSIVQGSEGSYRWFLRLMFKANSCQAKQLMNDFPWVDLYVHHMMDLDLAYFGVSLHSFDYQEKEMQTLDANNPGKLLHFVAFDPHRAANALSLVKCGLTNGAVGVKFYPPSGYRPSGNQEDKWDGYCEELFSYCESNNIPILTHCTPEGFEAKKGYGMNSDPAYWWPVLTKHPGLRLCFAHSGGKARWFADTAPSTNKIEFVQWNFATNVIALCLEFTNVFCDTAYLEALLKPGSLSMYSDQLSRVINSQTPGHSWKFGDKVMYGSDWHLLSKENGYCHYLEYFKQAFASPQLVPWQRAFFATNAISFLGLNDLRQERFTRLSLPQQEQLIELVKRCNTP